MRFPDHLGFSDKLHWLRSTAFANWIVTVSRTGHDPNSGIEAEARSWMANLVADMADELAEEYERIEAQRRKHLAAE